MKKYSLECYNLIADVVKKVASRCLLSAIRLEKEISESSSQTYAGVSISSVHKLLKLRHILKPNWFPLKITKKRKTFFFCPLEAKIHFLNAISRFLVCLNPLYLLKYNAGIFEIIYIHISAYNDNQNREHWSCLIILSKKN